MKPFAVALTLLLTLSCVPAADPSEGPNADYPGSVNQGQVFSFEQSEALRDEFEPSFASWSDGGDLSRYVFLNPSEFWPHIVLTEGTFTRALPSGSVDAVTDFTVTVQAGESTIGDYVNGSPTDAAIVVHDGRIVFEVRAELTLEDPSAWPRTALEDGSFKHNSYQWDIVTEDGHFFKSGFGGQGLYVAPDLDLVIAWFGTQDERGNTEMLSVARQLATSGVF